MIEFPEFKTIEERIEEVEDQHIKTISREYDDEEEDTDKDKLDHVLEQHTHNIAERKIGKFISRHFIAGALMDKDEDEIRSLIENNVVIPRRIMYEGGQLRQIVQTLIIPQGSKAVRDEWGDEKTEKAIHDWLNVMVPETQNIDTDILRGWIRLQIDYIRANILSKKPLVYDNIYDDIPAQQNQQTLTDKVRSIL